MKNKPWFPFYWKDWNNNIELKMCSLAAKGLLIDIMSILWQEGGRLHQLKGMDKAELKGRLILMLGVTHADGMKAIDELLEANRISFDEEGVLYCRKLVEIHEKQAKLSEAGKKGGNPKLKPQVKPPLKPKVKAKDKEYKDTFGEFANVLLSPEEYKKLLDIHGEDKLKAGIEKLGNGIASKGYKYKSHYATMNRGGWVWKDLQYKKNDGGVVF